MANPCRRLVAAVAALLGADLCAFTAHAAIDHNQVGAFLVFPYVAAESVPETGRTVETTLTITNLSYNSYVAHIVFMNGNELDPHYCWECGFDVPFGPRETHALVVTRANGVTQLRDHLTGFGRACSGRMGFVTVDVESPDFFVLSDNVLAGRSVTLDYTSGSAVALEAIPVKGYFGDGDRHHGFDGIEYFSFPRSVSTAFLAPDASPGISADLVVFTLGFRSRLPPVTDCIVTGIDAEGATFSVPFETGCWALRSLRDIDPRFTYSTLGQPARTDEHGRAQLDCRVFGTGTSGTADGGVHGVLIQSATAGALIRRNDPGPLLGAAARWGRVLIQSQTDGGPVTLQVDTPPVP